jgi:hypothetical protein
VGKFLYNDVLGMDYGKNLHIFSPQIANDSAPENIVTFVKISETELEVSFYKLKIRITSLFYLLICLCILFVLKSYSTHQTWTHLLHSLFIMNSFFIAYTLCSLFNQINVLYFHPEIIEYHRTKNND